MSIVYDQRVHVLISALLTQDVQTTTMSPSIQDVILTEHLNFPPLSLIDDIINTANALLYKSVSAVEQMFHSLPTSVVPNDEMEAGIHKFETLLESAIDRNFDAMELYVLRNVFNIPQDTLGWVRLKHHQGLDFVTDDSIEIEEELGRLQRALSSSSRIHTIIDRERQTNEQMLSLLSTCVQKTGFLDSEAQSHGVAPTRETAEFLEHQINDLQDLLRGISCYDKEVIEIGTTDRDRYIRQAQFRTITKRSFEGNLEDLELIGSLEDVRQMNERIAR